MAMSRGVWDWESRTVVFAPNANSTLISRRSPAYRERNNVGDEDEMCIHGPCTPTCGLQCICSRFIRQTNIKKQTNKHTILRAINI